MFPFEINLEQTLGGDHRSSSLQMQWFRSSEAKGNFLFPSEYIFE